MKGLMRRCERCGAYTLKDVCPKCGGRTAYAHPPKFSPQDRYLELRMKDRFLSTGKGPSS